MIGEYPGETHIEIEGTDLSGLDNEAGGHRIQRVPPTERRGRTHTSTVTVAIIDPTIPQMSLNDRDIQIEWYSGTGAGGQHRNKHQNSCRLTHIPTGITAISQCRSRQNSLDEAKTALEKKVIDTLYRDHKSSQASNRKQQVGSGQRGDKIRTYRFQDDMVHDHRTGKHASCERVMKGQLNLLW